MDSQRVNGFFATVIGVILVATGIAALWILVSSGMFNPLTTGADGPPNAAVEAAPAEVLTGPVRLTNSFQISQPRDPFRPLITPDSPVSDPPIVDPGDGTGNGNGDGNGDGNGNGNGNGDGNGNGFTPDTNTITLVAVRDDSGTLRATVDVNGTEYVVGVGDTFATSYKVVSLNSNGGVFSFGDTVFELDVGQQILK